MLKERDYINTREMLTQKCLFYLPHRERSVTPIYVVLYMRVISSSRVVQTGKEAVLMLLFTFVNKRSRYAFLRFLTQHR